MDSNDTGVIRQADAWLREGSRVHLLTVARTWGSSPRPAGSMLALADDGRIQGSISSGCIEEELLGRIWRENTRGHPRLLRYGTKRDEARQLGLPCGGRLELVIESLNRADALAELRGHMHAGRVVRRSVRLDGNPVTLTPLDTADEAVHFDGHTLSRTFGPRWHLLIIGAGQIGQYLASFARSLDYQVTLCDPRAEHARRWPTPEANRIHTAPEIAVSERAGPRTAVVTLSHDPGIDEPALHRALLSQNFYVGALGSRETSRRRRERLARKRLPPLVLDRLHAPVGLALGSHTPPEIALSIMAGITAVRNRAEPALPTGPGQRQ